MAWLAGQSGPARGERSLADYGLAHHGVTGDEAHIAEAYAVKKVITRGMKPCKYAFGIFFVRRHVDQNSETLHPGAAA